jgi:hypothetical protein
MEWMAGAAAIAVVAWFWFRAWKREREAANARLAREAELARQRLTHDVEAARATSLLEPPDPSLVEALRVLGPEVGAALREFDTLTTFEDVTEWDARAARVVTEAEQRWAQLNDYAARAAATIDRYRLANTDPPHVRAARIAKSVATLEHLRNVAGQIEEHYEALLDRIEQTPDDPQAQKALLRELRAEKRELQAQKKALKLDAAEIRRSVRQQSAEAGAWSFFGRPAYSPAQAAMERRALRRERERALQPNEDAVAALDRQILAVDRRILWVQRFGHEED